MPREVAFTSIVRGGVDSNGKTTAQPHLVPTATGPVWQSSRADNSPIGRFFGSVNNVVAVDASDPYDIRVVQGVARCRAFFGDHSWLLEGAFAARHPFSTIGEKVYAKQADGTCLLLVSYVSTRPTWFGSMIPYMAGVMTVTRRWYRQRYQRSRGCGAASRPAPLSVCFDAAPG